MTSASSILKTAADIVSGDRQRVHGPAREDFAKIATMWDAFLSIRRSDPGPLNSQDVAQMMELLKMARSQCGAHNLDDFIDSVGYAAIAGELAARNAA